jgi:hypothetical protein
MLIRFEIQMGDNGTVSSVQAQPNENQNAPAQKILPPAYAPAAAQQGGSPPVSGTGTGLPGVRSGAGTIFVLGPIVILGSSPDSALGGDPPVSPLGTGKPGADSEIKKRQENTD